MWSIHVGGFEGRLIGLLLWLAPMVVTIAIMAAIIRIERALSVPQVAWLGQDNFIIAPLVFVASLPVFMRAKWKYAHQPHRENRAVALPLVIAVSISTVVPRAVIGLQSGQSIDRFFAIIVVIGASTAM